MPHGAELGAEFADRLLALSSDEDREEFLRSKNLLDPNGLDHLLDTADALLDSDPGKAQDLAELCKTLVEAANAPVAAPRANYIRVQTAFINGEFEKALLLIESAHDGYLALGENVEALRTNVGKMAALLELGRYQEALDAGQAVLSSLNGEGYLEVNPLPEQADLLSALAHHNLGGCYEYMGRFEEALERYESAEELSEKLEMTEFSGRIRNDRGLVLLELGRAREALAAFEEALSLFGGIGLTSLQTKALINLGEAYIRLSDYRSSLEAYEKARRLLDSIEALADMNILLRDEADAYLMLNMYSEALAVYRQAEDALRDSGMAYEHARSLWGMGSVLTVRLEVEEAERVLEEAASLFREAGNAPMLSGVMLEQAALFSMRGEDRDARRKVEEALELVSGEDWPVQRFYAHLRLADLLLPNTAEAEAHLVEAQRMIERLALPQLRYRLNERLGRLRRLQGRDEEAERLLEEAVGEIERLRGTVIQETMRASFLRDKTAAYEDLLQLHLDRDSEGDARRAFAVAERAKSRALIDLLTGVVGKEFARSIDPELRELFQPMQADLNGVYNRLLAPTGDGGDGIATHELQERAVELEREIGRLQLRSAASTEAPDMFGSPTPDTGFDRLPPGTTLLAYHVVGDEVLAFVGSDDRIRIVRDLCEVAEAGELLRRLDTQWDRLGMGMEMPAKHMDLLERSVRRILSTLYDQLVRPLEAYIGEESPELVVVPHGPLHQAPFHALFDGERYLIERFEVSYAPSARVYDLCRERSSRELDSVLAMGVADDLIPAAIQEAHTVARCFPEADVLVDELATVNALESKASGCGALHLACHGMFRADNPMFSSLKLHDGWLKAADVLGLDLAGTTVALSACETGRGQVVGGDEVLGLTRAFLGAGAATLLVSLWLVRDETTAGMMASWYEKLRGGEKPAAALRAAQLEVKERHPHPYYWAPFVLVGKR
ncbi:MAG: CHAT domain-containing protein [Rubrobacteraceae bacterium]